MKKIAGHIVDVVSGTVYDGTITMEGERILSIESTEIVDDHYIIPGFIDAHIHIESSMMIPSEFARFVLPKGTVACVSDPHEIANVCGIEGVEYMIRNGKHTPLKFYFGAPSCVPATGFETSGAILDASKVEVLLQREDIHYLAEMMNFPGVLYGDEQVMLKIKAARDAGKPVDGHAPELSGEGLKTYVAAGISTDHECMSLKEAGEKIALGMHILIREGSAARNFDALIPLMEKHRDRIMFCSDDKHPDDLLKHGHIDHLVRRAVANGYDPVDVLRVCSLNPIRHYKLDIGLLQTGDTADFVIVDDLREFNVKSTWIRGERVAENGQVCFDRYVPESTINTFNASKISPELLRVTPEKKHIRVIVAEDGQLYTRSTLHKPLIRQGNLVSDIENDVLKLVVYNRYQPALPAIGFIRNFGLKKGALVSTVAHDSHNIVAVGTSDELIAAAINRVIDNQGGIIAMDETNECLVPLPVGGLMSDADGMTVAALYEKADALAKKLGCTLAAPFMTLAFMSLLCIPELKLGDRGLFEILKLSFTDLQTD